MSVEGVAMKGSTLVVPLAVALLALSAQAQNSQQDKMKTCNAQAKTQNLAGDARQSFMKTCLSNQPADTPKLNSQQQKMKQCNADATAKGLKGADRKTYTSTCLKGS
jgi:psiF repeat